MRWKPEVPRFLRVRSKRRPPEQGLCQVDRDQLGTTTRRVALALTIRGDVIEMSARPNRGVSLVIEEIAKGLDPGHISFRLDALTSLSPSVWLAAVGRNDVRLTVVVRGADDTEPRTFQTTILGGTIVPLRAFFDSAGMAMLSGSCIDLIVLDGSGPIRVFRRARRFRRILN